MEDSNEPRPSLAAAALLGIALTLFGIAVALGLFEVAFRLFLNKQSAKWNDRPVKYFAAEGSPTFQDNPYLPEKPKGVFRIAAIGDSFTFAPYMQLNNAYPKQLEWMLNLNSNQPKVEVINYGVPAYSTSHEVPVVERAIKEGADLILMQITLNDPEIKPYTPTELYREKNKFGELELQGPLFQHWKSLAYVLKRIHNRETQKNYVDKFFKLFNSPDTWGNFSDSWRKISQISNDKKVPTYAVIFPLFGMPVNDSYPFWPIDQKIESLLDSLSIKHLDITELYRNIPVERLQVLPGEDFHPNEIAHRMAAEKMLEWLSSKKALPQSIVPKLGSPSRVGTKKPTA